MISQHVVLECGSNKMQRGTQRIPRDPLPYYVSHMGSAWWIAELGWRTSAGKVSRGILARDHPLGLY